MTIVAPGHVTIRNGPHRINDQGDQAARLRGMATLLLPPDCFRV